MLCFEGKVHWTQFDINIVRKNVLHPASPERYCLYRLSNCKKYIMAWWCILQKITATPWENLFMPYANNKGAVQQVHSCSLFSTSVVHCLDSVIPPVSISKISNLYLASVAMQAGLSLPWSQTPKTGFLVTWLIIKEMSRKSRLMSKPIK